MTYRGIVLVTEDETYRVRDGKIKLSMGALDYLSPETFTDGPSVRSEPFPFASGIIGSLLGTEVMRSKALQFGQVLSLGAHTLVVGLAHPELA